MRHWLTMLVALFAASCQDTGNTNTRPDFVEASDDFLVNAAKGLSGPQMSVADSAVMSDVAFELRKIPDLLKAERELDLDISHTTGDTAWVNYRVHSRSERETLQIVLRRVDGEWRPIAVAVPSRI